MRVTASTRPRLRTRITRGATALVLGMGTVVAAVTTAQPASADPLGITSDWASAPSMALDPTCTFLSSWDGPQVSLAPAPGNQVWVTLDGCDDLNSRAALLDGTDGSVVSGWEVTPKYEQTGAGAAVDATGQLTRPFDALNDLDPAATTYEARVAAGTWTSAGDCPAGTVPGSLFDGGAALGLYCVDSTGSGPDYVRTIAGTTTDISLGTSGGGSGLLAVGLRADATPTALGVTNPDITTIEQWNGSSWSATALSAPINQIPAYPAGSDATGRAIVFGSTVNSGGYPVHEITTSGQVNSGTVPAHSTFFANAAVDDAGKLYVAELDSGATQLTIDKYALVAVPPGTGDTVEFTVTGQIGYSNSQTVTTGGVTILKDANGIRTVVANATFPSAVSGSATVFANVNRFWILPVYLGTVKVYDTAATIALQHVVFFSKVTAVSTTGATNTQGWADFSKFPWKSYSMTWTFHDIV